jgi:hypothetical protein
VTAESVGSSGKLRFPPTCPRQRSRDARAVGSYQPQRFLITFDPSVPFITPERRRDIRYFHIFAHEYFHYWHNISTVSGFKLLGFNQQLLAAFSRTLNEPFDGTSAGSDVLSGEDLFHSPEVIALISDLEGHGAPRAELLHQPGVTFAVVDFIVDHHRKAPLRSQRVPNPSAELDVVTFWPNGKSEEARMSLGAFAIEEGIAMLVEEAIAPLVPDGRIGEVFEYPYRVLERTVEKVVGARQSPFICASLGTLALLSTHPGPVLIVLSNLYRERLEGAEPDDALALVVEETEGLRASDIQTAREGAARLARTLEGRALAAVALEHYQAQFDAAMQLRAEDPLIDVKTVFKAENPRGAVMNMMLKFPSCDIVQQADGKEDDIERDRTLGEPLDTDSGFNTSESTRVLHAQLDYVWAHIDRESGEFVPSSEVTAKCPYYTTCQLPLRATQRELCGTQPWRSVEEPGGLCPYAVGVRAVFGPIELKKPVR